MTHKQFRIRWVILQWSYHSAGKLHQDFRGMVRDETCSEIITTYSFLLHNVFSINSLISLHQLQKRVLQRAPCRQYCREWLHGGETPGSTQRMRRDERETASVEAVKGLEVYNGGSSNFTLQGKRYMNYWGKYLHCRQWENYFLLVWNDDCLFIPFYCLVFLPQ